MYQLPKGQSVSDAMIDKTCFYFDKKDRACLFLDKYLVNPFVEIYKGNKIIMAYKKSSNEDVFINISRVTKYYSDHKCFEWSSNVTNLRLSIDKRINKTSTSIVT